MGQFVGNGRFTVIFLQSLVLGPSRFSGRPGMLGYLGGSPFYTGVNIQGVLCPPMFETHE
jgi:hypothetical protein